MFVEGLGGEGGTFWHLNEGLTFMGPEAWQATTVNQIGVNKIPPNFDTVCGIFRSRSSLKT